MADLTLRCVGVLQGHKGWVTAISTVPQNPELICSSSRDKKVIVWKLTPDNRDCYGYAQKSLSGHGQAVSDVVMSADGSYALSGSWDSTLRLWDLKQGECTKVFGGGPGGHKSDVFSVAFSPDYRQIVSASRDKTIKLWNTLGECKYTIEHEGHTDWVSCVRFTPPGEDPQKNPAIVTCGWDKLVKLWDVGECRLQTNLAGHTGPLYSVTISPDGSLCASGGKDGVAMLWDLNEGKHLSSLETQVPVNALCFSPKHYWLCAATDTSIKIWDLEEKTVLEDLQPSQPLGQSGIPWCVSLAWSESGDVLFAGSTDGNIYVYEVVQRGGAA